RAVHPGQPYRAPDGGDRRAALEHRAGARVGEPGAWEVRRLDAQLQVWPAGMPPGAGPHTQRRDGRVVGDPAPRGPGADAHTPLRLGPEQLADPVGGRGPGAVRAARAGDDSLQPEAPAVEHRSGRDPEISSALTRPHTAR